MTKSFYLITWKEFTDRKMDDKCDIMSTENAEADLTLFKQMNAQKRLTTTDYRIYNLTKIAEDNSLLLTSETKE